MTELGQFDPTDPVDLIADLFRREVGAAALTVLSSPEYLDASPEDRMNGFICGAMVGALGAIGAITLPGSEAEMRAMLLRHLPYWFDAGIAISGRKPLGDLQ